MSSASAPAPHGKPLLVVRGLSKRFGGLQAVAELDLDVRVGEILGVIGPNGAGKSTTFNMIAGALVPTEGTLAFDGEQLAGLPAHAMAARGIMRTFQHNKPFASMSVRENVMVGMHRRLKGSLWKVWAAGAAFVKAVEQRPRCGRRIAARGPFDHAGGICGDGRTAATTGTRAR